MNINALLNPEIEEETKDVEMVDSPATTTYSLRAAPVEVGGYRYNYPSPTNSPFHQYRLNQPPTPPTFTPSKKSHSNKSYDRQQIHWIRYQKIDRKHGWNAIKHDFSQKFPKRNPTYNGLDSAYYRDNYIPRIDQDGNIIYDAFGDVLSMDMRVRERDMGERKEAPWSFIERHPWAALKYEWVTAKHKKMAARIVAEIEGTDPRWYTRKQQFVLSIRRCEDEKDFLKQRREVLSEAAAYKLYMDGLYEEAAAQRHLA